MKKLLVFTIGLGLALGTFSFAQDTSSTTTTTKKDKKTKKKKSDTTEPDKK
jgi:hypothetical protein